MCQRELHHNLPLEAYLIRPVQRILKYNLLLQVIRERGREGEREGGRERGRERERGRGREWCNCHVVVCYGKSFV